MILDRELQLSFEQPITVSAYSENIINLGPPGVNKYSIGDPGGEFYLHFQIVETFDTAGEAGTLAVELRTADNDAMTSPTTLLTVNAVEADLVAGQNPFGAIRVPYRAKQYLAAYYTVGGGPFTAGKISLTGGAEPQTQV